LRCVDTLSRGSDILRVVRRPVVPLLCQALELVGIEVTLALRYGRSDHIEGALRGSYGLLEHQVSFQPKPVWLCVLVEWGLRLVVHDHTRWVRDRWSSHRHIKGVCPLLGGRLHQHGGGAHIDSSEQRVKHPCRKWKGGCRGCAFVVFLRVFLQVLLKLVIKLVPPVRLGRPER